MDNDIRKDIYTDLFGLCAISMLVTMSIWKRIFSKWKRPIVILFTICSETRHSLFRFIYSPFQRISFQAALLILHMNKMWKHKKKLIPIGYFCQHLTFPENHIMSWSDIINIFYWLRICCTIFCISINMQLIWFSICFYRLCFSFWDV